MNFEFATSARIVFGRGCSRQLGDLARGLGSTALLVLGQRGRGRDDFTALLGAAGATCRVVHVAEEPITHLVDQAAALARREGCDLVVALGGGSVIDAGKAVAAMITNPGDVLDYLEVVGGGKPLLNPSVPFIAVPTTAGTGTEATRNAVLGVPEHQVKASLRGRSLLPRLALVDPALSDSLPPTVTAYTGMDAITQLIEALVSRAANPMTDAVCREGLQRAGRSLRIAFHDGGNQPARDDMCLAALLSGIALANARLGAVHGLAGVLGGVTGHPHGALCARLLPFVMEANLRALQDDPAGQDTLRRYDDVARLLIGTASASARDAVEYVHALSDELQIPALRDAGLTAAACPSVIAAAQRSSSMKGNPVTLAEQELLRILELAL
jgi:alcohol dehydrogenase class IV